MSRAAEQLHSRADLLEPGQNAPLDLTIFIPCCNENLYIIATIGTVVSAMKENGQIN